MRHFRGVVWVGLGWVRRALAPGWRSRVGRLRGGCGAVADGLRCVEVGWASYTGRLAVYWAA